LYIGNPAINNNTLTISHILIKRHLFRFKFPALFNLDTKALLINNLYKYRSDIYRRHLKKPVIAEEERRSNLVAMHNPFACR
jgi:hypothetical protein